MIKKGYDNMTIEKIKNMFRFAEIIGIKTTRELLAYKRKKRLKTNEELYLSLYAMALMCRNETK